MTVLKFSTHVTSDPLYSDQGISFKVIFGERPVFCFTNRADVVSSIMGLGLSLGDSIEMTATMLNVEKGFYQTETTLKVMQIELIETYHVYRKRKREERDEPSAPLNNKKRKGEFGPPIVDDMSLCSGERSASSNGSISVSHYDVQEYEGAFMEFYDELEESISRFQSQLVEPDPVIEEKLTKVRGLMDRLWLLFKAIQDLTGSDELVVIIRFVDLVKRIISAMDEFAPRFPENGNGPRKHNILLPTYIFNRFMENRR